MDELAVEGSNMRDLRVSITLVVERGLHAGVVVDDGVAARLRSQFSAFVRVLRPFGG